MLTMKAKMKCPKCGFEEDIEVPEKACLQFWKCKSCGEMVSAPKNECCVVCAYSDKKCPVHGEKHG